MKKVIFVCLLTFSCSTAEDISYGNVPEFSMPQHWVQKYAIPPEYVTLDWPGNCDAIGALSFSTAVLMPLEIYLDDLVKAYNNMIDKYTMIKNALSSSMANGALGSRVLVNSGLYDEMLFELKRGNELLSQEIEMLERSYLEK